MAVIDKILNRYNVSGNKAKIAKNIYWAILGKLVTLFGTFIVGIIVARYLGPEQYGLMSYIISIVAIFQVIASFGLDGIEIREETQIPKKRDILIGTAFWLRIMFAVITILCLAIVIFLKENDSYVRAMTMIYSISMIFNSFIVIRNHFTSLVWNEYVVKSEINRTIVGTVIKVGLLLLKASLTWFIISLVFDAILLASGYIYAYEKKIARITLWKFDKRTAKYFIQQAFPLLLSGAAVIVYQKIDQVMLKMLLNATAVGQYAIANSFVDIFVFIPTIISQTITPILVKQYQEDKSKYESEAQVFLNITNWICILVAIGISLLSYPLIKYTYGEQYIAATNIMQIVIFRLLGVSMAQISGQMMISEHIQQQVAWRNVVGCIICVALNMILIPKIGVIGAAISGVVTSLISGYIAHLIIRPYRHIFVMQTKSLFLGWRDLICINKIFHKTYGKDI